MQAMSNYAFTEKDVRTIQWQLDSDRVGMSGVMDRCAYGYPRIMLLDPAPAADKEEVYNNEALSNIMWLTCPYLNEKIHELEDKGYIAKISKFISGDIDLRGMMHNAHAHFYFLRKSVYVNRFGELEPPENTRLFNTGVGGIRDISTLKCLHTHFCHYRICDENLAGYVTSRLLRNKINCEEVRCRNAHKKQ